MFTHDNIDRIIGADVIDATGDKVGSVGQVFLDDQTNQPSWITVNTGLFGTKETFIPLDGANLDGDVIRIGHEKGFIKDAPNVDADNGHLSPAEEQELYRYYNLEHGTAGYADRDVVEGDRTVADRDRVETDRHVEGDVDATARAERLNVGTEQVEAGRARIRKYVTTEQQQVTVPVQKEKLVVEREAVDGRPVAGGIDARDGEVVDEEITLREERPVVSKETVETEHVRIGKETVTENQVVSGEVAQEHIEVEGAEGVRDGIADDRTARQGRLDDVDGRLDLDGDGR